MVAAEITPKEVRSIRLALGVDAEEFALLLRAEAATVHAWELGETRPTPDQVREMHRIFQSVCGDRAVVADEKSLWGHLSRKRGGHS